MKLPSPTDGTWSASGPTTGPSTYHSGTLVSSSVGARVTTGARAALCSCSCALGARDAQRDLVGRSWRRPRPHPHTEMQYS